LKELKNTKKKNHLLEEDVSFVRIQVDEEGNEEEILTSQLEDFVHEYQE